MSEENVTKPSLRIWEFLLLIVVCAVVAIIIVPGFKRAQESAQRSSCAGTLKQFGMICKMYSNENNGAYPPRSSFLTPGSYMPDPLLLFPDYWNDPQLALCPADSHSRDKSVEEWLPDGSPDDFLSYPDEEILKDGLSLIHTDPDIAAQYYLRSWSYSYMYTDFMVWDWAGLRAIDDARKSAVQNNIVETIELSLRGTKLKGLPESVTYAPGFAEMDELTPGETIPELGYFSEEKGFTGSTATSSSEIEIPIPLMRIKAGVERHIMQGTPGGVAQRQSQIPIMWDAISYHPSNDSKSNPKYTVNHGDRLSGNILFMDGHVEYRGPCSLPSTCYFPFEEELFDTTVLETFRAGEG